MNLECHCSMMLQELLNVVSIKWNAVSHLNCIEINLNDTGKDRQIKASFLFSFVLPCILPERSDRTPAVSGPCGAPDWPVLRGSAVQAEAALRPSGAGWREPYGTGPAQMGTRHSSPNGVKFQTQKFSLCEKCASISASYQCSCS